MILIHSLPANTATKYGGSSRSARRALPLLSLFALLIQLAVSPVQASAIDAERKAISLSLATEPPTLNSAVATDTIANFLLSHIMEGLLRYGANGELVAGVAERWELSPDGAHFWLRDDARWSDGTPVRAQDFVFAWRHALRPETASQYAFILFPIRNAEAVNRGELAASALGVTALNDRELRVEFSRPCPYFLSLTAFMTYLPLREDAVEQWGRAYAADADKLLSNGPFELSKWVHGAALTLQRSEHYWDRDAIKLQEIDIPYITSDPGGQFNLFRDRQIALANLDSGLLNEAVKRDYPIHQFHSGALFFLEFNFRPGRITANKAFRKAVQHLLDPALLVNKIIGLPGMVPAYSLFPVTVTGPPAPDGHPRRFREVYPVLKVEANLALARQYLRQAKRELGLEEWPALHLLVGDSPRAQQEAEYYQYLFQRGLGIDLRIDQQIFKQRLEKMGRGQFDIVAAAWGPDYDDILTFADLFSSWNENNRGRYSNPRYDALVRIAENSADPKTRFEAMAKLQELVVDDVPILPTYESVQLYVQTPGLRGVRRSIFGGDPVFRDAWIEAQ